MQEKEKAAGKEKAKGQKLEKIKNWFHGLSTEYKKIVWTDKETLAKQTVVVVIITIILSVIISVMDAGILQCLNLLIK